MYSLIYSAIIFLCQIYLAVFCLQFQYNHIMSRELQSFLIQCRKFLWYLIDLLIYFTQTYFLNGKRFRNEKSQQTKKKSYLINLGIFIRCLLFHQKKILKKNHAFVHRLYLYYYCLNIGVYLKFYWKFKKKKTYSNKSEKSSKV